MNPKLIIKKFNSNLHYFIMYGLLGLLLGGGFSPVQAQKSIKPRLRESPLAMVNFLSENDSYIKITYGQPYKKNRVIFGELVPYGEVWRTGANEATEFTCTQDIRIRLENEEKELKAGTYTIFTVPNREKWEIIFNQALGQWGAYQYKDISDQNVLTFELPREKSEDTYEAFTILLEETKKGVDMIFLWDQTKVNIPIILEDE